MRYRRKPKWQRPPKPMYHPIHGYEMTRAEQEQYWREKREADIAAAEAARQAWWDSLTPEQRAEHQREWTQNEEWWRRKHAEDRERAAQREWERRHDPFSTFGT
jgi:hypothetical protein